MELLGFVKSKSALQTRTFEGTQGAQVIKSVVVEISNGIDTLLCEANGALAEHLDKQNIDPHTLVGASIRLVVRKTQDGKKFVNIYLRDLAVL